MPVRYDDIASLLELCKVSDYFRVIEFVGVEVRFEDDYRDTVGFDPFHDALDGGGTEIVGA